MQFVVAGKKLRSLHLKPQPSGVSLSLTLLLKPARCDAPNENEAPTEQSEDASETAQHALAEGDHRNV